MRRVLSTLTLIGALCTLRVALAEPSSSSTNASTKPSAPACPPGKVQALDAPPGTCAAPFHSCEPGKHWSELHDGCIVVCPAGKAANAAGTGCVEDTHHCPEGTQWYGSRSACLPFCVPGRVLDYTKGTCVEVEARTPTPASTPAPAPKAATPAPKPVKVKAPKPASKRADTPTSCPPGREWKSAFDACVPICADGEVLDFYGRACHSIRPRR